MMYLWASVAASDSVSGTLAQSESEILFCESAAHAIDLIFVTQLNYLLD